MDVLVQGLFKCFKLLEYEAVTVAGIFWSCIAVGQMLYVAIAFSFNVMFCHHDGYGSFDASTVEFGQGSIFQLSLYHLIDVGKQYQFLFVEMGIEVGNHEREPAHCRVTDVFHRVRDIFYPAVLQSRDLVYGYYGGGF